MEQRRTYEKLDRPEVLAALFYARQETTPTPAGAQDHEIEVEAGVVLGARFFLTDDPAAVNLLFFHGNGEVVSDYDDAGPRYNEQGVNFLAVDYRGYGRSTGTPGVGAMIEDAHRALDWVLAWLAGQPTQWPRRLTLTTRPSTSASSMSPPSFCRRGRISFSMTSSMSRMRWMLVSRFTGWGAGCGASPRAWAMSASIFSWHLAQPPPALV